MLPISLRAAVLSLMAGVSFLPFEQAYAQTTGEAGASTPAASAALSEIVVTAERRAENSQKVPIAIAHIDGQAIENAGITQVTDLQLLTPGLQYDPSNGSAFQIRGVGSTSFDFSNAKSVSIVVDDVVLDAQRTAGLFGLVDIANVDVLLGPQGTLFGMNSTSGVIAITTGKPKLGEFSGRASASYGERNDRILNGTVNIPINQNTALRLSAFDNAQDGYGRNATLHSDIGAFDEYGFRGKLLYQPSDRFDLTVAGDWAHHWDTATVRTPAGGQPAVLTNALNALGIFPSRSNVDTADGVAGYTKDDEWGGSVRAHVKVGDNDLTSITAYRGSSWINSQPSDFVPLNVWSYVPYNTGHLQTKKFSEEIHFASPTGQFFEYLAGAFYNRLEASQDSYQWATLGVPTISPTGVPLAKYSNLTGAIGQSGNGRRVDAVNESAAAFGQVRLNFTPQFTVAIGGRYTKDWNSQGLSFINIDPVPIIGYTPIFVPTAAGPSQSFGRRNGQNFSVRISPEYHFNSNVMAYLTFSTGYKPGGVAYVSNIYDPFKEETVKSYEAGVKSEWLGHRLRVNADVFREDFTDFQTSLQTTVPGSALPVIAVGNAGGLRSQGAEVAVQVKPTPELTLSGSLTYTDAYFTDYRYNTTTNYTGTRLTNSPKYAGNVSVDYQRDLSSSWEIRAHGDYAYRSDTWSVIGQPAYSKNPAYSIVNARIAVAPINGHVEFGVYARNLFNQYFSTGWLTSPALGDLHYTTANAFRTVGGFINVKF